MKYSAILISTCVFLFLIGANFVAGKWFFKQAMPTARIALESRLGVQIETGLTGVWRKAAGEVSEKARFWHALAIPGVHFLLLMGALIVILLQLLAFFLLARLVSPSGS